VKYGDIQLRHDLKNERKNISWSEGKENIGERQVKVVVSDDAKYFLITSNGEVVIEWTDEDQNENNT